jgi:hypothetical protein
MEETLQGGRRAVHGQRELLAHDGDGEINALDAAQDVRHEIAALEGLRVPPKGRLVVCAAVDVIEYRGRVAVAWLDVGNHGSCDNDANACLLALQSAQAREACRPRPHSQPLELRGGRVRKSLDARHV